MEKDIHGNPIPALRPEETTIELAINASTGASAKTVAVGAAGVYRVWSSVDAYLQFGSSPTAAKTYPISAGIPERVRLLDTDCIAGIAIGTVAGSVFATREK